MRVMLQLFKSTFFAVFIFTVSFAQTGKIAGRVIDSKTGEGLPFVNIIIEGTTLGAASDIDGYYSMIGIPPGVYSIKASAIGFSSTTVQNAKVSIDLTTKIDFTLTEATIELGQEVVVIAQKPLVTKDLTSSTAIVGGDDIAALPVTEFREVLELKAGIVDGKVRGGRKGEIVYALDGVPISDVYDGEAVVEVNTNSIQEMQFISGAFNAEYGRALGAYVNIATKDGNNNFNGMITTYFGSHYSTHTDIFRSIDNFEPFAIRNFEGNLSGPVIPNTLFFYVNARYIYFDGWYKGQRLYNPWDLTVNLGTSVPLENRYIIFSSGDGEIIPMNWSEKIYGQGKLTFRPFTDIKLNYNYIYERVDYRDFDQTFTFNPDGDFKKFRWGNTNILGLTHTLGANAFYQLNLSYFFKRFRQYVYEDPNDPRFTHDYLLNQQPADVPSFKTGGTQASQFKRTTGTYGAKFDLTSQVTKVHQIKFGADFSRHNLSFDDIKLIQDETALDPIFTGNPYVHRRIPDPNDPDENLNIDIYERKPVEFSAYVQDKIELTEMIINIGVRFDYFQPDGQILTDPTDPDIYRPKNPVNIAKTLDERRTYWYKDATSKFKVSPRLGVAFPITDRGVIHFSYGHFFQIPNFEFLYTNPEFKFKPSTGNAGIAGNPDLKPEETISGEVGLQQAFSDDITVDITGYFRDIRNLTGTRADEIRMFGGAGKYSQYVNSDFGFVKGIVLTLTKRLTNNWSATVDYTLQSAKGNASDPAATRQQIIDGKLPEIQLVRLNSDQTHTINVTFNYVSPANWGFSLIGNYGSGFPYTPTQSQNLSALLTNSELKPATLNVDLRAFKDFIFGNLKFSLFARIYNLFDITNQTDVYKDSGTADFTIEEFIRRQQDLPPLVNTLDEYYRKPDYYSEPRRIEMGLSFFF